MSDSALRFAIAALTNLLRLVVGRGKVQSGADDGPVQILQVSLSPKEVANLKRLAEFGFASWPLPGADAVAIFVGGNRSNGVIIATGDQSLRFKLDAAGEVAISDAFGKSIWLKKTGGIVIEASGQDVTVDGATNVIVNASAKVTLTTPLVEISGNLTVDGNITAGGTIGDAVRTLEQDRAIYDTHTHSGVTAGGAHTGPPDQPE